MDRDNPSGTSTLARLGATARLCLRRPQIDDAGTLAPMINLAGRYGLLAFVAAACTAVPSPPTSTPRTDTPPAPTSTQVVPDPTRTHVTLPAATAAATHAPVNAASTGCDNPLPATRRFGVAEWPDTNFCRHSAPYEEIVGGGPGRDGIPALDQPIFDNTARAAEWLQDQEPVLLFVHNGDARAYPLQVMIWHEIVNDEVGGLPVAVTYCPLCNSGVVFARTVDGAVLDFGVSGQLRNSDLIMFDRQTASWWQQFTGEAIVGDLTGARLELLPSALAAWSDFRDQYPVGRVLSLDTGYEDIPYGENPYFAYDSMTNPNPYGFVGEWDARLHPKARVAAVEIEGHALAYPLDVLAEVRVVNDELAGAPLVVFWKAGAASALYAGQVADGKLVGSSAVFERAFEGQVLTFRWESEAFRDDQTGSVWNIFGQATTGALAGAQLKRIASHEYLWFAWAAFQPDTEIYQP
ncbi:MAG: DUF3179 domain-containing protein [Anaerolineales bacterium]